jgi:hypothetical protein
LECDGNDVRKKASQALREGKLKDRGWEWRFICASFFVWSLFLHSKSFVKLDSKVVFNKHDLWRKCLQIQNDNY